MEITVIQVFIDNPHDIGSPQSPAGCIHIVPFPFQFFKMVLNAFVICACFRVALLVNIKIICCLGHDEIDIDNKIFGYI